MNDEMLKVNILTITVAGFLMLLTGLLLYLFRSTVSENMRFILPIPPLGVAAYVFVFNLFSHYHGKLPGNIGDTLRELVLSAVIAGIIFCAFIVINVAITNLLKDIL
ncbi:MAG: hypothetical protein HY868_26415 [Chloroflexi bacterium]|nr:hypothetical protein [Chloroflexota bacterium]